MKEARQGLANMKRADTFFDLRRPEKEHALQIRSLHALFEMETHHRSTLRLILAGSVRNDSDAERVSQLRTLVSLLGLEVR